MAPNSSLVEALLHFQPQLLPLSCRGLSPATLFRNPLCHSAHCYLFHLTPSSSRLSSRHGALTAAWDSCFQYQNTWVLSLSSASDFSFMLMCILRRQMMAQVLGFLPPKCETKIRVPTSWLQPGLAPVKMKDERCLPLCFLSNK